MRLSGLSSLLMIGVLCCCGCGSNETPSATPTDGPGQANFAGRLEAADAITNVATKDAALLKLAQDAAAAKNIGLAKKAVDAITNTVTKDNAAGKAALTLGKLGMGKEALAVAQSITNSVTRDGVLAKLAKGEFG